jgi:hypothetical protein
MTLVVTYAVDKSSVKKTENSLSLFPNYAVLRIVFSFPRPEIHTLFQQECLFARNAKPCTYVGPKKEKKK